MKRIFLYFLLNAGFMYGIAQTKTEEVKATYEQVIDTRAGKIVETLEITDSAKFNRVKKIIANQYKSLNEIYTARDMEIKNAKMQLNTDKEGLTLAVSKIEKRSDSLVQNLHPTFLSALSKELTTTQVDQVKDGMTYNVLHVTYNGYTQMILDLSDAQKKQIMDWLVEAREHAMDAESSDKKHAWFGKYKGRINNYLSAAGYDLKKEGEAWEKRRKEKAKQ